MEADRLTYTWRQTDWWQKDTWTDNLVDRLTDIWRQNRTDRQTERKTEIPTDKHTHGQTDTWTDWQWDRQTNRHVDSKHLASNSAFTGSAHKLKLVENSNVAIWAKIYLCPWYVSCFHLSSSWAFLTCCGFLIFHQILWALICHQLVGRSWLVIKLWVFNLSSSCHHVLGFELSLRWHILTHIPGTTNETRLARKSVTHMKTHSSCSWSTESTVLITMTFYIALVSA